MQCQATTKVGTQCLRKADFGAIYCWQHHGYTGTSNTITRPEFKEARLSPRDKKQPIKKAEPFFNENEFKLINTNTTAKINNEEGATDYKEAKGHNNIIARGPLKIDIEVGEAEPVVLAYELDLPAGDYTYENIIDQIRNFFDQKVTHKNLFDLIRLSDEYENENARQLYKELQDLSATEDLRLYDLNASNIYIEGIRYDSILKKYYLILGS